MPGSIFLKYNSETIAVKKFKDGGSVSTANKVWEKLYPTKFKNCEIVIEKDKAPENTKSAFRKGQITRCVKFGAVMRSKKGMNNY